MSLKNLMAGNQEIGFLEIMFGNNNDNMKLSKLNAKARKFVEKEQEA